jgi:hypothetical protein
VSPAAHRRGADRSPVAHLDDLFTVQEPESPPHPGRDRGRPWRLRAALHAFIASAVVYSGLQVANLSAPYGLILAVCAGVVLVRLAVKATAEPTWLRARDLVRPVRVRRHDELGLWHSFDDGMIDAVHRWDRRLDWGGADPERFAHTVGIRLGELADERLRQHHGMTRQSDPSQARALLGEEVWAIVSGPLQGVPTPRQMSAAITRLEQLDRLGDGGRSGNNAHSEEATQQGYGGPGV